MQAEKIVNVKFVGIKKVYDLEVDSEDHLYYQNRIVGHNSHGFEYGSISYCTAYAKAHFPEHFFTSSLFFAKSKADTLEEVEGLVSNCRQHKIEISTPSIKTLFIGNHGEFGLSKRGIHFGVANIKGVGENEMLSLINSVKKASEFLKKPPEKFGWLEILSYICTEVKMNSLEAMVNCGVFDFTGKFRTEMIYELSHFKEIKKNDTELEYLRKNCSNFKTLSDLLKSFVLLDKKSGGPKTSGRKEKIMEIIKVLDKPPYSLKDNIHGIIEKEKEKLGIAISATKLDVCDSFAADSTIQEFNNGKTGKMSLAVEIKRASDYIIKKSGKSMGFLTVEDQTGTLDNVVCFTDQWDMYKHVLYQGNTVLLEGKKSNTGSFQIEKVLSI